MSPEISVVIPVKNAGAVFDECLNALKTNHVTMHEIIVVDDCSTDNTPEIARKHSCHIITLPKTKGPANARNTGARAAQGDILFFIDSDIILPSDTLQKLKTTFQNPNIIAITGVQSENLRYKNFISQYKNLWMRYSYLQLPEMVALFYTSCAAIRRDFFLKSGGFDTGYRRPSVEDTDFGQKLEMMGYSVHLRPDIEVEHVKYYSLLQILKTDFYRSADLVKMTLRNRLSRFLRGNKTSVPATFMTGVLLFLSSIPLCLLYLFLSAMRPLCIIVYLVILGSFFFINRSFLFWLKSQRGWMFFLQSILFLLLDIPVVTAGIMWGVVDYMRGRHY